jgi:hypothetical protein
LVSVDGSDPTVLENLETLASVLQAIVTSVAIAVGGIWAYYRFVKERTYRPRLAVTIGARLSSTHGGRSVLATRVAVKNIGASNVELVRRGTGLRISTALLPDQDFSEVGWESKRVFSVFAEHEWIEPNELVSHDALVTVPSESGPWLLEVRLVWRWESRNIAVYARRAVPPFDEILGPHD